MITATERVLPLSHYATDEGHFVQFYEDDSRLVTSASAFLADGIRKGEAALAIATEDHRKAIAGLLRLKGFETERLLDARQLILLDAEELLSKFMVQGLPDRTAFRKSVAPILVEAMRCFPSVRAFGEMVNLLWARGNVPATLRLEHEWNELRREYDFTLFCSYGLDHFKRGADSSGFRDICDAHSFALPSTNLVEITARNTQLRYIAELEQKAKALEGEIAERKRAEEALAQSNEELRSFAYSVSHDLKEPLRTIRMYLQLVERLGKKTLAGEPRIERSIRFVIDAAGRMDALLAGTLAYARLDADKQSTTIVDANAVFDEAVANLEDSIRNAGATVTRANLPKVKAFRIQLAQVFQNLISNGIKFRGNAPPVIHVEAAREDQTDPWIFSITDNGMGIPPEYQERVFVAFQRLHTSGEYPGSGLGLSICRKVIEKMGGRMWVESEAGKGSRFKFTLSS